MKKKPDLVIFATDGFGAAPKDAPVGYEVIWLLTGQHAQAPVPWGTSIRIED